MRSRGCCGQTIRASGWPIRWKSRSWQFTSRRTILRTSSGQTSRSTAVSGPFRPWAPKLRCRESRPLLLRVRQGTAPTVNRRHANKRFWRLRSCSSPIEEMINVHVVGRSNRMSNKPSVVLVHGFWGDAAHWAKVIVELNGRGYGSLHAVENPLTSLSDDAERTRKMVKQVDGPVLLVGHSYGGAVITEAGDLPNVVGLVYIAAFAPDAGESTERINQVLPPAATDSLVRDSNGYLWNRRDRFHENFGHDLAADEALVMAVTQKPPLASTYTDKV